jgi:hypothetical protein
MIRLANGAQVLAPNASSKLRRCRHGENVAPAEAPQVERREAPHPYVTGVRAPDRNGARRTLARFARVRIATHPAPPGALMSPVKPRWRNISPSPRIPLEVIEAMIVQR